MYDVTAIGELLIDFTPSGYSSDGKLIFAQNPGGAPANVLAANSRLGGKTAFIGKVGNDDFGSFLRNTLKSINICVSNLIFSDCVHTTLAFVQLNNEGDRSFTFYRAPGADITLTSDEVDQNLLNNTHILHFGSVSLTDEPSRSATLHTVKKSKDFGAIISYDPNYRAPLWKSKQEAVQQMKSVLPYTDIVKVSEEELELLTNERKLKDGARAIQRLGASLVLVTLGENGAFYLLGDECGVIPTYQVNTIDTNGAGDSFLGAVHFKLRDKNLKEIRNLTKYEIEEIVSFANAAGSLTTTKMGAIPAMPFYEEIESCRRSLSVIH